MSITLRGMTWSHPRGYDPMIAASRDYLEKTGIAVTWDKRSLQDFESFPVEELAAQYDLIVIDHPHVGQITDEGCLLPLDVPPHQAELKAQASASVGPSFPSYHYAGHQWALPIDAATQVQAWRPDRLEGPVHDMRDVVSLAREGKVLLPLRPPHSLMCFFTLAAHLGHPCNHAGEELIARDHGLAVMDWLTQLAEPMPDEAYGFDPIAVLDSMGETDSPHVLSPLIYGYVSYSLDGFRPGRIAFGDMPVIDGRPPAGSAIGGTGIAVSARSQHPEEARDFAVWLSGAAVQSGVYAASGGQPGHAAAWESEAVNAPVLNFYRNTRATLEGGWLRPRHNGYMTFQGEASEALTAGLKEKTAPGLILDRLDFLFRQTAPRNGTR